MIEVRGFGADNKKFTCQEFNLFEGDIDLDMFNTTVKYMAEQYS